MSSTRAQLIDKRSRDHKQRLKTKWLGETIIHETSVTSTQRIAHDLACDGYESGTIVIADEQTDGRGSHNRKWQSAKGKGIWMSIILRPDISPHQAPQLTLLTASALAKIFEANIHPEPKIKWPNDLLINDQKTAGILTEMHTEQHHINYIIIGIGINVNHKENDLNDDLTKHATSLYQVTGKYWNVIRLIHQILPTFESMYEVFTNHGFASVKSYWEKYAYKMNDRITVKNNKQAQDGFMRGIADDGALKIEINGKTKKLYSGEIEWTP